MRLNDPLATSIFFKDKEYQIDLSFNRVLDVLEIAERKDILKGHKLSIMLPLLITKDSFLSLNYTEQIELWTLILDEHINMGAKRHIRYDLDGNPMPDVSDEKSEDVLDLKEDAKYIYASFRQIGINLFKEQNKMHWEEFQALLEALPEDTIMQKIIQIRAWKPVKGDSISYKNQMRKLQEKYRLGEDGEIDE